MAVAECLKARDDRLVQGLVAVKRLRVLDRKLCAGCCVIKSDVMLPLDTTTNATTVPGLVFIFKNTGFLPVT